MNQFQRAEKFEIICDLQPFSNLAKIRKDKSWDSDSLKWNDIYNQNKKDLIWIVNLKKIKIQLILLKSTSLLVSWLVI